MTNSNHAREKFRFLHISDLHLSIHSDNTNIISSISSRTDSNSYEPLSIKNFLRMALYPSTYKPSRLEGLFKIINSIHNTENITAIIISGDISSTGKLHDLKKSRDILVDGIQMENGNSRLNLPKIPIIILPGNHDRLTGLFFPPYWIPGSKNFEKVFGDAWSINNNNIIKNGKYIRYTTIAKGHEKIRLISIDLSLRLIDFIYFRFNLKKIFMTGCANKFRLIALLKKIFKLHDKIPSIIITHFPPNEQYNINLSVDYINGSDALMKSLDSLHPSIILSGHIHRSATLSDKTNTYIACAGTATSTEDYGCNSFHLLEVTTSNGNVRQINSTEYNWEAFAGFIMSPKSVCWNSFNDS